MAEQFTILVDDREKKPYSFARYPVKTETVRLKTGDYAVKGDGTFTDGTFYPNFAVERKSEEDFLHSITWSRDRFEDELERADGFSKRMPIVVEQKLDYFLDDQHYADVHPNAIKATLESHPAKYYVDYFFTRDRQRAAQLAYEWLEHRSRQI